MATADVRLMDGGRVKWIAEGRELTTDVPTAGPARRTSRSRRIARCAHSATRWRRSSAAPDIALVDVRSPKEYSGELLAPENLPQEGAQRGGHIPGAQNVPWATAVAEDGTFKSASRAARDLRRQGRHPDTATIAYCRIGERSAHTWFVLTELLGYPDVRNYDGSWTEWGSLIGAPIER